MRQSSLTESYGPIVTATLVGLLLMLTLPLIVPGLAAGASPVPRLAGPERVATSIAVSRAGWDRSSQVVLARADDPADALAGTSLAGRLDAPLLITRSSEVPTAVMREIRRLGATRAVLLGGENALSPAVTKALRRNGLGVERVAGVTRYGTAAAVAGRLDATKGGVVYVVGAWPDALALSGHAARRAAAGNAVPVLLADRDLPRPTADALERLQPAQVHILDSAEAVSPTVDRAIRDLGFEVQRITPKTRYQASLQILGANKPTTPEPLLVVTGDNFPDALSAGAYAARSGSALLLAPGRNADRGHVDWLHQNADRVSRLLAIGGPNAVSARTLFELHEAVETSRANPDDIVADPEAPVETPEEDVADPEAPAETPEEDVTGPEAPAETPEEDEHANMPDVDVMLEVGDDFQQIVDRNRPGTHYGIAPGKHRMQSVVPKDGDTFTGAPGAVLSGARVLDGWKQDGHGRWYVDGQTQQATTTGEWGSRGYAYDEVADSGHEQEVYYAEELFADGQRLRHVNSLSDVNRPGTWYFDYDADRITMYGGPAGRLMETSVTDYAFVGAGVSDVTVENLVVRNYASRGARGAINGRDSRGWTIRRVDASYNHGGGIGLAAGMEVTGSRIAHNGQIGLVGSGSHTPDAPIVIRGNEIAHNHAIGFEQGWEAGGMKLSQSIGTLFEDNWVHHNGAKGVWFDIDNVDATIRNNLVEHNEIAGIFYEISYNAIIADNVVRHNHDPANNGTYLGGVGINVVDSPNVEVRGNVLHDNYIEFSAMHQMRSTGHYGSRGVRNLYVHDNDMTIDGPPVGVRLRSGESNPYTAEANNRFDANTYRLDNSAQRVWWWDDSSRTWQEWTGRGHDGSGVLAEGSAATSGMESLANETYGPAS